MLPLPVRIDSFTEVLVTAGALQSALLRSYSAVYYYPKEHHNRISILCRSPFART